VQSTLNIILDYLEEKGVIMIGKKGVLWVHNENPKMKRLLEQSVDVSEIAIRQNKFSARRKQAISDHAQELRAPKSIRSS
jgi:exosome complex RNA-binding protein Rrp4